MRPSGKSDRGLLWPLASRELFSFALVGCSATFAYAAIALALQAVTGLPTALASLAAYACSSVLSYFGHRYLTFRSHRPHREAAGRFAAVTVAGYLTALVMPALVAWAFDAPPAAAIAGTALAIPAMNYVALSLLVFRQSGQGAGPPAAVKVGRNAD